MPPSPDTITPPPRTPAMPKRVFVDGQAGTVGLSIHQRLSGMPDIAVLDIPETQRKDLDARLQRILDADLAVLCLPDQAAIEVVSELNQRSHNTTKILDASTAHRVAPGWVYGFPELTPDQPDRIRGAQQVTNPGCYATGIIALLRPLIDAGLIPPDHPLSIHATSGYSGGGRALISAMETGQHPPFKLYSLDLQHKHLPEIRAHARLTQAPIFTPAVGNYRQGMLVTIPLHLHAIPGQPTADAIAQTLHERYAHNPRVAFVPDPQDPQRFELEPQALNHTDRLEIRVFSQPKHGQALLIARLDNLGIGAAGNAVTNTRLMLGLGMV
ncbi:MAG: N-acetyl-gamma-glutamyl-phosphate reductase [Planctomycetota bacterium]